jgi:adenylate cyclase
MKKIAILMADLTGYTALTEIHGPEAAALIIKKYVDLAHKSLIGDSYMLERIGDQLVIVSSNADDLAKTAIELYKKVSMEDHFLAIHAAIHFGDILEIDGHLYGSTINLTSRIATNAKEGKILVTDDFINALSEPNDFLFSFHNQIRFKNIREAKNIYEMIQETGFSYKKKRIDPVCHMLLEDHEDEFTFEHHNKTHYFCSDHCKHIFIEQVNHVHLMLNN